MNDSQLRLEGQLCDETTDTGAEENGLEFVNKILPKKKHLGRIRSNIYCYDDL